VVSSFEREVLVLRSGVSGPERSRVQVAQTLDTSVGRVRRGERSGLRGLRDAARSTGCGKSAAMSFSDSGSGSDQMASATVAVATGGTPSLRPVATMAGSTDSQLASVRTRPARQVLGASAESGLASSGKEKPLASPVPLSAASGVDGPPSPLFLLFLLLLLVPLTIVALRRRPDAAGYSPSAEPVSESLAAPQPMPEPPTAPAEPRPAPVPEPSSPGPPMAPGRGRTIAGVAAGLASVAVGRLLSRRLRARRRR